MFCPVEKRPVFESPLPSGLPLPDDEHLRRGVLERGRPLIKGERHRQLARGKREGTGPAWLHISHPAGEKMVPFGRSCIWIVTWSLSTIRSGWSSTAMAPAVPVRIQRAGRRRRCVRSPGDGRVSRSGMRDEGRVPESDHVLLGDGRGQITRVSSEIEIAKRICRGIDMAGSYIIVNYQLTQN